MVPRRTAAAAGGDGDDIFVEVPDTVLNELSQLLEVLRYFNSDDHRVVGITDDPLTGAPNLFSCSCGNSFLSGILYVRHLILNVLMLDLPGLAEFVRRKSSTEGNRTLALDQARDSSQIGRLLALPAPRTPPQNVGVNLVSLLGRAPGVTGAAAVPAPPQAKKSPKKKRATASRKSRGSIVKDIALAPTPISTPKAVVASSTSTPKTAEISKTPREKFYYWRNRDGHGIEKRLESGRMLCFCGQTFARLSSIDRHVRDKWEPKVFTCTHPGCVRVYAHKHHLKMHMANHKPVSTLAKAVEAEVAAATPAPAATVSKRKMSGRASNAGVVKQKETSPPAPVEPVTVAPAPEPEEAKVVKVAKNRNKKKTVQVAAATAVNEPEQDNPTVAVAAAPAPEPEPEEAEAKLGNRKVAKSRKKRTVAVPEVEKAMLIGQALALPKPAGAGKAKVAAAKSRSKKTIAIQVVDVNVEPEPEVEVAKENSNPDPFIPAPLSIPAPFGTGEVAEAETTEHEAEPAKEKAKSGSRKRKANADSSLEGKNILPLETPGRRRARQVKDKATPKSSESAAGSGRIKCDRDGCDKSYSSMKSLKTHIMVQHDKIPVLCEICGVNVKYAANLRKHQTSLKCKEAQAAKENALAAAVAAIVGKEGSQLPAPAAGQPMTSASSSVELNQVQVHPGVVLMEAETIFHSEPQPTEEQDPLIQALDLRVVFMSPEAVPVPAPVSVAVVAPFPAPAPEEMQVEGSGSAPLKENQDPKLAPTSTTNNAADPQGKDHVQESNATHRQVLASKFFPDTSVTIVPAPIPAPTDIPAEAVGVVGPIPEDLVFSFEFPVPPAAETDTEEEEVLFSDTEDTTTTAGEESSLSLDFDDESSIGSAATTGDTVTVSGETLDTPSGGGGGGGSLVVTLNVPNYSLKPSSPLTFPKDFCGANNNQ